MSELLLAHRFRVRSTLSNADGVGLHEVRDAASERSGWLLHLAGSNMGAMELAIRHRLRDFGLLSICAPCEVLDTVADGEGLYLLLRAPSANFRPLTIEECTPKLAAELAGGLRELALSGRFAGRLAPQHLALLDGQRVLLLPSAYAFPPTVEQQEPARFADRPGSWGRFEVEAFAAQCKLALELPEVAPTATAVSSASGAILDCLERPGIRAAVVLENSIDSQLGVHASLAELARRWNRAVFVSAPHVRPLHGPRVRGDDRPALIILDNFDRYPRFAEGLWSARKAGWLDGRESYLVLRQSSGSDVASRLWLQSLRQQVAERWREAAPPPSGSVVTAWAPGQKSNVLELLSVVGHPLSATVVARALSLDANALLTALHSLRDAGGVELGYGVPDAGDPGIQLVVFPVAGRQIDVSNTRAGELMALLGAVLDAGRTRAGFGRQWIQFELAVFGNPQRALVLARGLVERAERAAMPLLSYAMHARVLDEAKSLNPSLGDRCRAAIAMGDQHRERGEVRQAEQIFETALRDLQSASGREAATLAADLILIIVQLRTHQARYEECDTLLQDAIERFRDQLDSTRRGRLYLRHADVLYSLGRFVDARQRGELARKLLDAEAHPADAAMVYNRLALTLWQQSAYEEALTHMQRSLVLWQQVGDELWASRVYNNISLVQRAMGRLNDSERALQRAMELKQRVGDQKGLAAAQLNMGFLAIELEHFDDAIERARLCLEQAKTLNQGELEAQAHGLWGEAAMYAGRFEEARHHYDLDIELSERHKMRNEHLATLRRLVDLLLREGKLDEAASCLQEARNAVPEAGSRYEAAMLDLLEARLLEKCGADEAALDIYGSAASIFAQLHRRDLQLVALASRGLLQSRSGRAKAAFRTLTQLRDFIAEFELTRLPREMRELEQLAAEAVGEPEAHVAVISALADLLAEREPGSEAARLACFDLITRVLAPRQILWIDAISGAVSGVDGASLDADNAAILELRAAAFAAPGQVVAGANQWFAAACGNLGVLALQRLRPLPPEERELLRLLAASLALLRTPQGMPRETVAVGGIAAADELGIIGQSPPMRDVLRQVELVRANAVPILLLGENGTGKDMVARAIHRSGDRRSANFHAINCAAIPAALLESELFGHERGAFTGAHDRHLGVFERADGGTLFLDEIGEMPMEMQAKLLRVLQDQTFQRVGGNEPLRSDVRVIAATNRELRRMVDEGSFRMDLYFRLNVISIQIPPLRERGEDIGLLARYFIQRFAGEFKSRVQGISQEAVARLMEYSWPGNVRELENVLKNAMVFAESDRIRVEDLPTQVLGSRASRSGQSVEDAVRAMVVEDQLSEDRPLMPRLELLLAAEVVRAVGNKTRAARLLGITKPTLYSRLRRFDALYGGAAAGARKD